MATSECLPCEETYDPTLDNRRRKTSPLATTAFAFVEAMDEPCHVTILLTPLRRLMRLRRVSSERPVPTEWHRHTADSLYLFLADADIHTQTDAQAAPVLTHAKAEAAFFAPHSRAPLVHQGEDAPRPVHRSLQRHTHMRTHPADAHTQLTRYGTSRRRSLPGRKHDALCPRRRAARATAVRRERTARPSESSATPRRAAQLDERPSRHEMRLLYSLYSSCSYDDF